MSQPLSFGLDPPEQDVASLAREAMEHAQAAMASGDQHEAIRWFDRACRLLPRDPTLKLLLATACLRAEPTRATDLLRELARSHDGPTVRAGLAALGASLDGPPPDPGHIEGVVDWDDAGVHGWAWHPHDPERDPVLTVVPDRAPRFTFVAIEPAEPAPDTLLARPRGFHIPWTGLGQSVRILDACRCDLLGSPIVFGAERRPPPRGTGHSPPWQIPSPRPVDVVAALDAVPAVLRNTPTDCRVFVVTSGEAPSALGSDPRIRVLRLPDPRSRAALLNAALRAAGLPAGAPHDVIILNDDTVVGRHWIDRLRGAAYGAPDCGIALALAEDAGSFDEPPCLYIRRDCLDATGLLREDLFAQGSGAEHDFCLRAAAGGWRCVVVPGVLAAPIRIRRHDPAADALVRRNRRILRALHPDHATLLQSRTTAAPPHRRLDAIRFRSKQRNRDSVLIITHDEGGGVERVVQAAVAAHEAAGRRAVVLRPNGDGAVLVSDGDQARYPSLRFSRPERAALMRLLRAVRPVAAEIHHLLGHDPAIADLPGRLAIPYSVHIHDHGWVCPRVVLIDPDGRYCGEPDAPACDRCIARGGTAFRWVTSTAAFRQRCGAILAGAEQVIAPSGDTAARLRRYLPAQQVTVVPHESHMPLPAAPAAAPHHVCIVGALGVQKGFRVLLDCAQDVAARNLPLRFTVVGTTIADALLLGTGRVFITGPFMPDEATRLVRAQNASIGWLPSIWPETWCFALSDLWHAGLKAVVFDIGAQAERVRASGRGVLLPLGLPPPRINDALLALSVL